VTHCWKLMLQARCNKEVPKLGLWGSDQHLQNAFSKCTAMGTVDVVSQECFAGWSLDTNTVWAMSLTDQETAVEFFHLLGRDQSLLEQPAVKEVAEELAATPAMLATKWAEQKGIRAVMPPLQHVNGAASKERVPGGGLAMDGSPRHVSIHRTFVREYRQAPPADLCATLLDKAACNSVAPDKKESKDFTDPVRGDTHASCAPSETTSLHHMVDSTSFAKRKSDGFPNGLRSGGLGRLQHALVMNCSEYAHGHPLTARASSDPQELRAWASHGRSRTLPTPFQEEGRGEVLVNGVLGPASGEETTFRLHGGSRSTQPRIKTLGSLRLHDSPVGSLKNVPNPVMAGQLGPPAVTDVPQKRIVENSTVLPLSRDCRDFINSLPAKDLMLQQAVVRMSDLGLNTEEIANVFSLSCSSVQELASLAALSSSSMP